MGSKRHLAEESRRALSASVAFYGAAAYRAAARDSDGEAAARVLDQMRERGLLTGAEHEAVRLLGRAHALVGQEGAADADAPETCSRIRDVQRRILGRAAARAYQEKFRVPEGGSQLNIRIDPDPVVPELAPPAAGSDEDEDS